MAQLPCHSEQPICDIRHKSDREFLEKSLEVLDVRMTASDKAISVAEKEADKQYDHLNKLRESMVLYEVYRVQYKSLNDKYDALQRLVYIGLGVMLTIQAIAYLLIRFIKV